METRFCDKCRQEKPVTEFYKSTRGGCKKCVRTYQNKWYTENKAVGDTNKRKDPEGFKTCSRCKELKSIDEYYRDKSSPTGYQHRCKECSDKGRKKRRLREKARNLVYTAEIPEGYKICSKCKTLYPLTEFHKTHGKYWSPCKNCKYEYKQTDRYKEQQKEYSNREDIKPKLRENQRRHRQKSEAKAKAKVRRVEYDQRDYVREKNKALNKAYRNRPENQEKARQKTIEWRKANPERQNHQSRIKRARKREAEGSHTVEQWEKLVSFFDHCPGCGEKEPLTCDHIVPLNKGGSDWITNLQPLCLRCNTAKRDYFVKDYRSPEVKAWAEAEMELIQVEG